MTLTLFILLPGGGRTLIRLAALAVLLLVVVVLSPALLIWSLFPPGRAFVLQLLAELRTWTTALVGPDALAPARRPQVGTLRTSGEPGRTGAGRGSV